MKAIHILKQDDLYLIENTETKKVFVASDVKGKERVCEHEHDKKDFIKHYQSSNDNDKPCKKCRLNDKKNSKIQVKLGDLNPDAQNAIKSTASLFFPCFDTKDFLFFLEVRAKLLQWVYNINQDVFVFTEDTGGEQDLKPEILETIKQFFVEIANLYNRDFGAKIEISRVLSIYLHVKNEVTKAIKSISKDIWIDFLSEEEILAVLSRRSVGPFQYTNNNTERLEYLQSVFTELYRPMDSSSKTLYNDVLPEVKIMYRPTKFENYFRTTSMLKTISVSLSNQGIHFGSLITNAGPSFRMNKELLSVLKKAKECSNFSFYSDVRAIFADYFKFQDNEQLSFFLSLDTPSDVKEFAEYKKQQKKFPDLAYFRVPVIKIQYKQYVYDDDDEKVIKTNVVQKQVLLNIYDMYFNLALFDDDGILMGKYYVDTKNYADITIIAVV
jgi:hypothetical protein